MSPWLIYLSAQSLCFLLSEQESKFNKYIKQPYILIVVFSYEIIHWSWVCLWQLTVTEFLVFYGVRTLVIVFTGARCWFQFGPRVPVHSLCSFKVHFNILPFTPMSSKWPVLSGFSIIGLYAFLVPLVRVACPAPSILPDFIAVSIFDKK